MGSIISPNGNGLDYLTMMKRAADRINLVSGQVNFLLEELYIATNGEHGCFKRNQKLKDDTRHAIELRLGQREKPVKVQVPTPDFTREQMKKLDAEMKK